jgi:hypothetical protein
MLVDVVFAHGQNFLNRCPYTCITLVGQMSIELQKQTNCIVAIRYYCKLTYFIRLRVQKTLQKLFEFFNQEPPAFNSNYFNILFELQFASVQPKVD